MHARTKLWQPVDPPYPCLREGQGDDFNGDFKSAESCEVQPKFRLHKGQGQERRT
jgi:hypothetical protein